MEAEAPITRNRYLYCRNDPVNLKDPDGRTWFWVQETGELAHLNDGTGKVRRFVAQGYSGAPDFVNIPNTDHMKNKGPIPAGAYRIDSKFTNSRKLRNKLNLTILEPENAYGRDLFRFHGDNCSGDNSASTGCPIASFSIRKDVVGSGDSLFIVVAYPEELDQLKIDYLVSSAIARIKKPGNSIKVFDQDVPLPNSEE